MPLPSFPPHGPDYAQMMREATSTLAQARCRHIEAWMSARAAEGVQVHLLRHHPDGRVSALVSPMGQMLTALAEVWIIDDPKRGAPPKPR